MEGSRGVEFSVFHGLNLFPVLSPDFEGQATSAADGIVISSPEYVRAIPGGLKNAIDWMVSRHEIIKKSIAPAHASYRGDDMLASLRLFLSTVSNQFLEHTFLRIPLIGKTQSEIIFLLRQPDYRSGIAEFLSGFAAKIEQLEEKNGPLNGGFGRLSK